MKQRIRLVDVIEEHQHLLVVTDHFLNLELLGELELADEVLNEAEVVSRVEHQVSKENQVLLPHLLHEALLIRPGLLYHLG